MQFKKRLKKIKTHIDEYLSKKFHRSFRLTRKRDYNKPIKLAGNIIFTKKVIKIILKNKKLFMFLALFYS